jgi:hypothetical protein
MHASATDLPQDRIDRGVIEDRIPEMLPLVETVGDILETVAGRSRFRPERKTQADDVTEEDLLRVGRDLGPAVQRVLSV